MAGVRGTAAGAGAGAGPGARVAPTLEGFRGAAGHGPGGRRATVAGFGSLLSERSARFTFPELENFREGRVRGWRRGFAHTTPVFLQRGIANLETREMGSLSCEAAVGAEIVVCLFDVNLDEAFVNAWVEREHEYQFVAAPVFTLGGQPLPEPALLCTAWTDEGYMRERCTGPDEFWERYGQYGVDRVWRDDVLPCRAYLRHCVLAARNLSPEAHASFLDQTFLADRRTTIREHLARDPTIMQELPPESLAVRYGG